MFGTLLFWYLLAMTGTSDYVVFLFLALRTVVETFLNNRGEYRAQTGIWRLLGFVSVRTIKGRSIDLETFRARADPGIILSVLVAQLVGLLLI